MRDCTAYTAPCRRTFEQRTRVRSLGSQRDRSPEASGRLSLGGGLRVLSFLSATDPSLPGGVITLLRARTSDDPTARRLHLLPTQASEGRVHTRAQVTQATSQGTKQTAARHGDPAETRVADRTARQSAPGTRLTGSCSGLGTALRQAVRSPLVHKHGDDYTHRLACLRL